MILHICMNTIIGHLYNLVWLIISWFVWRLITIVFNKFNVQLVHIMVRWLHIEIIFTQFIMFCFIIWLLKYVILANEMYVNPTIMSSYFFAKVMVGIAKSTKWEQIHDKWLCFVWLSNINGIYIHCQILPNIHINRIKVAYISQIMIYVYHKASWI